MTRQLLTMHPAAPAPCVPCSPPPSPPVLTGPQPWMVEWQDEFNRRECVRVCVWQHGCGCGGHGRMYMYQCHVGRAAPAPLFAACVRALVLPPSAAKQAPPPPPPPPRPAVAADPLDPSFAWHAQLGDGSYYNIQGWGNNEASWYTDLRDNLRIDPVLLADGSYSKDSQLVIEAKYVPGAPAGQQYTSARIRTLGKVAVAPTAGSRVRIEVGAAAAKGCLRLACPPLLAFRCLVTAVALCRPRQCGATHTELPHAAAAAVAACRPALRSPQVWGCGPPSGCCRRRTPMRHAAAAAFTVGAR